MKRVSIFMLALFSIGLSFGQAKKPVIMVVPSDVWCNQNGYMEEIDDQGRKVKIPSYQQAFQENSDIVNVISKINEMMKDRGYPLKDLEASLKTLASESAENAVLTTKSGAGIVESPIDKLKKTAKADIWIKLTWTVNNIGPKKSITFNMQGMDAYTDKQVAGASGTGPQSFTPELAVMLEEAVLAHIDNFNTQLMTHFDDLFANGREITLRVKRTEAFDGDLETEYDGEELSVIIENWVSSNTEKGRFNSSNVTENEMFLEQVRIPLYDASNKAIDARAWGRGLQKFLSEKYQITSKVMMKGLGGVTLLIGDK